MMDMIAFQEGSVAIGARASTTTLQNIAGMADTHVTVLADTILVPARCNKILAVYFESQVTAAANNTDQVQISSPSLRATSLLDIANWVNNGAVADETQIPPNNAPFNMFKEAPIELMPGEALQAFSAVLVAAAAENVVMPIILTDGDLSMPLTGRIESLVADGTIIPAPFVWSASPVIFRQALRSGTYAVVGMKASSPTCTAARLIFGNQGERPGTIGSNTLENTVEQMGGLFRYGRLGLWGTFRDTNPPQVELLCSDADPVATQQFYLDVIKI